MNIIELNHVDFRWQKADDLTLAIDSLAIKRGHKVLLNGDSGSGKSTLLSLLTGINKPEQGSIKILGVEITALSNAKMDNFRADHIGYIFQQFNLIPYLSVVENVLLSCRFSKKRGSNSLKENVTQAHALLSQLDIGSHLFDRNITQLSIGQQQRVAAARALIGAPEIIIADEPCSALDPVNSQRFIELLMRECEQQQSTLILVSHDESLSSWFDYQLPLSQINLASQLT
ncbi:MAG: putative ABC transport system ATP-binding protein [Oceanospirillaceae bacterium]|jgi:putative ABC transport system ATP-binding protein